MIPPGTLLGAVQVALPGGPTVGQVAPGGQHVHLAKLDGWWDPTATTGESTQRPNDHGAWVGPAYYAARVVQLEARCDGFSPADSMAIARTLINAVPLDALAPMTVTDEAGTLTALMRQEGDPLLVRQGNRVVVSLSMLAPDPRRYGPEVVASTGLAVTTGGLSLPISLPVSLNATSATGTVTVVNAGDMESFPTFTVAGPVGPFFITDAATGRSLAFNEPVPAGRFLLIDTANRTALLDGVASRVVTGTWPRLAPESSTTFAFEAVYDPASLLTVRYRSAWS